MQRAVMAALTLALMIDGAAAASAQPASIAPAGALAAVTSTKPSLYLRAQGRLRELGEYKGPVNGRRDAATVAAIKKFQMIKKLPVSGRLTPETVKALGV
ncbi:MAG TPA: peptidoglycan-binding domain-containing protein [Caulobacterales bacterium]|nr:peptidoglycan-binding domain-containing protein [Caulobacterales bacterium]